MSCYIVSVQAAVKINFENKTGAPASSFTVTIHPVDSSGGFIRDPQTGDYKSTVLTSLPQTLSMPQHSYVFISPCQTREKRVCGGSEHWTIDRQGEPVLADRGCTCIQGHQGRGHGCIDWYSATTTGCAQGKDGQTYVLSMIDDPEWGGSKNYFSITPKS
jgi:hypothetical protein